MRVYVYKFLLKRSFWNLRNRGDVLLALWRKYQIRNRDTIIVLSLEALNIRVMNQLASLRSRTSSARRAAALLKKEEEKKPKL